MMNSRLAAAVLILIIVSPSTFAEEQEVAYIDFARSFKHIGQLVNNDDMILAIQSESEAREKAEIAMTSKASSLCEGALDLSADTENHPKKVVNKAAGCPLGLQLPGLPSISGAINVPGACGIVQAATREAVDEINNSIAEQISLLDSQIEEAVGQDADLGEEFGIESSSSSSVGFDSDNLGSE